LERKSKEFNEADFSLKLTKQENEHIKKEMHELDDKFREYLIEYKFLEERNNL